MAYQQRGLIYFLLFVFIKNATSVCKISLSPDILGIVKNFENANSPLIYKYKSDGTPIAVYPSADSNCIFQSEDPLLHLACPGPNSTVQFYQMVGNETQVVNATSSSVYLLHDPSSSTSLRVHGGPRSFAIVSGNHISCFSWQYPTMYLLNVTKAPSVEGYVVGYRLNDADLLRIYDQVFRDEEWIVTRYRIKPIIQNRPAHLFSEWMSGLFYQKMSVNFTELYSKEYQIAEFQRYFHDVELTEKYFAGNNLLVTGELIFDEDTFYLNELKSMHFFENTAPMWKSVYEGNWRSIGSVIRKIADESTRDLDVYVSAWPSYHVNWTESWTLGNTTTSPDIIPVPQILVKAAVDVDNHDRGVVFHTFNDPHLDRQAVMEQLNDYCSNTIDCKEMHPEFEDVYKGYTFCCMPEHSYIFKQKFEL